MAAPKLPKPLVEDVIANLKYYRDSHQSVEDSSFRSDISIKWFHPPPRKSRAVRSVFTGVEAGLGHFMGRIRFKYNGVEIDLFNTNFSRVIPFDIGKITDMSSDALFILLAENDCAIFDLEQWGFFNGIPCIVVRSLDGVPSVRTGLFLKKLHTDLNLPVLALMDWNPNSFNILAFYGRGSEDAYGSSAKNLKTPDIKWLGMKFSDYDKYSLSKKYMSSMTVKDVKMANDMLEKDLLKNNPAWADELELMVKEGKKGELEAFGKGQCNLEFLVFHVLPEKLGEQYWF